MQPAHDAKPVHRVMVGIRDVARAATPVHHVLRNRIAGIVAVSAIFDLVCGVIAWRLEDGHGEIRSFGDALFWTTTQMLTVSSQFPNPLTTGGKVLDVILELYAVVVVTSVAGAFASFFHGRSRAMGLHPPGEAPPAH